MSLLNTTPPSDAKRYQTSKEDLSYRELRFAGWYIRNKVRLANIFRALLLSWCIGSVGYSSVMWLLYGLVGYNQDQALLRASVTQFQDYRLLQPTFAPQGLIVGSTTSRRETTDKQSYATEVRNPNTAWVATVVYAYDGARTAEQVILPGERSVLFDLGVPVDSPSPRLDILSIRWQRIDAHTIADPIAFIAARLQTAVRDVESTSADSTLGMPSTVSFTLSNESAYGYWEAAYIALLYSGNELIAVRSILIDRFAPGDEARIEFNFGSDRLGITDVEVIPLINVFDPEVYLPISAHSR